MKALFVLALFLFQVGAGFALPCRPIEYTELKDTSTDRLIATYCNYLDSAITNGEITKKYLEIKSLRISAGQSTADVEGEITKSSASMEECFAQTKKIRSALTNRSYDGQLVCEAK